MSMFTPASPRWTSRMLSVLRIAAGLVFILHGTQKLLGWPPAPRPMPFVLLSRYGAAGIIETFGGLAFILGLLTRPVAFLLAGEMAVAYFTVHVRRGVIPTSNGGDLAALFCFVYLYFTFAGAGVWSLDAVIARSKGGAPPPHETRRPYDAAA